MLILVLLIGYTFFKLYIFVLKEDNSYCLQSLIHFRFRIIAFSAIAEMLKEGSADVFKHFKNRYLQMPCVGLMEFVKFFDPV